MKTTTAQRRARVTALWLPVLMLIFAVATPPPTAAQASLGRSKWEYESTKDQMRGTITRLAGIESENAEFFPNSPSAFSGGRATLLLRQRPLDGLNIVLIIKGQFTCDSDLGGSVAAKFDSGEILQFPCGRPSDGSTGQLFIRDEARFVSALKSSTRVIIETEVFGQGAHQWTFDTHGLQW